MVVLLSNLISIWQCCGWSAGQISQWSEKSWKPESRGFEISWNLTVRSLSTKWIEALYHEFRNHTFKITATSLSTNELMNSSLGVRLWSVAWRPWSVMEVMNSGCLQFPIAVLDGNRCVYSWSRFSRIEKIRFFKWQPGNLIRNEYSGAYFNISCVIWVENSHLQTPYIDEQELGQNPLNLHIIRSVCTLSASIHDIALYLPLWCWKQNVPRELGCC